MNRFFAQKPIEPVPGDKVLPLHFFENNQLVQGNNMAVSLVFDKVLDPEMLRQSLEGLVKRDGWQRLGGRLRKNVSFTLDDILFIPTPFRSTLGIGQHRMAYSRNFHSRKAGNLFCSR